MTRAGLLRTLVAVVLISTTARSAIADNAPGVTSNEIKVGATFPFSGPASSLSAAGKALIAYVKHLNEEGGINGRLINLIALDDAYSPPKAVEQTRRLVEGDDVAFMFGQQGTPTNSATIRYLTAKRVPSLFIITGGAKFSNFKDYPYTTTGIWSYERGAGLRTLYSGNAAERQDCALVSER